MTPPWRHPVPTRLTPGPDGTTYVYLDEPLAVRRGDVLVLSGARVFLVHRRWRWLDALWRWAVPFPHTSLGTEAP